MVVNHLFTKQFYNYLIKSTNSVQISRSLCNQQPYNFENVYSNSNLKRCLYSLDGLDYDKVNSEEKKNFFEIKNKNAKKAAVLIPFCYNQFNEPSILFTLRSAKLLIHKWEVCFPGGKLCDRQDDGDITKTAARETCEELGISNDLIQIVGVLNAIPGKQSNTFIFPVLAKIDLTNNIEFNNKCQDEVEEVIIRPLSELIREDNWCFTHWANGMTTPVYRDKVFNDINRPRCWGLTSYLTFQILSNLLPDHFKVKYSLLTRYK